MFDDTDEILMEEQLITKCGPYLRLLKHLAAQGIKRPLLRGSMDDYSELTRVQVKPREMTMNMSKTNTQIANEWFVEEFGIAARTDTVFTTTNRGMASSYGRINMVFPIGKFSIIHSENYKDLFYALGSKNILETLEEENYDLASLYDHVSDDEPKMNEALIEAMIKNDPEGYKKVVKRVLEKGDYKKNEFANAFKSGHEIMLRCKAYFIVGADERIEDFINDFIWDDLGL